MVVERGSSIVTPTAPKVRQVLALLALKANSIVRTDQLVEELWGERPPRSAATTLQTYIYQLRERYLLRDRAAASLRTVSSGYVLDLDEDCVDVERFARAAERGRAEYDAGEVESAAETLREALRLWRGPALFDVSVGPVLRVFSVWLQELGRNTLELRIDVDLTLGLHADLVGELAALVADGPTHEGFQARLILALYRSGRRADALRAFELAREALDRELGVDPSPRLWELRRGILNTDPKLDTVAELPARARTSHGVVTSSARLR
nr:MULTISPECIES: AfsR/SARP family transcriptional regulator [Amycolatopsis]